MMGTLAGVLAGKKIRTSEHLYYTIAEGDIENVEGVIRITRIRATYYLKVTKDKAEDAREGFSSYLHLCPAAQSVINCIEISDNLILEEMG